MGRHSLAAATAMSTATIMTTATITNINHHDHGHHHGDGDGGYDHGCSARRVDGCRRLWRRRLWLRKPRGGMGLRRSWRWLLGSSPRLSNKHSAGSGSLPCRPNDLNIPAILHSLPSRLHLLIFRPTRFPRLSGAARVFEPAAAWSRVLRPCLPKTAQQFLPS